MIQINLIPDIKQEFLNAQRMRNTVITFSILTMLAAGAVIVLLLLILGVEATRNALADNTIKTEYAKLQENENLNSLVTIQNQLENIPDINNTKLLSSRLFEVLSVINPAAPNDIKMNTVDLDPSKKTITIEGSAANSFTATDIMKKTILNTDIEFVRSGNSSASVDLTNDVAITETTYGEDSQGGKVLRFRMSFVYPVELFSNDLESVAIVSPTARVDVTDSKVQVPDSLFTARPHDAKEGE